MFNKEDKHLVVSGGTGGHVIPANLIAKELDGDSYVESRVFKMFSKILIPNTKEFYLKNNLFSLFKSLFVFLNIVEKYDVIIGAGSIYTIPALVAGFLKGKRLFVHEQNATIGTANRFMRFFFGAQILGSFKGIGDIDFGLPMNKVDISQYKEHMGNKYILVFAGSLGSDFIDNLAPIIAKFAQKHNYTVYHQAKNIEKVKEIYGPNSIVSNLFSDFESLYYYASIVICRAGASTISYLQILEKTALLIPLKVAQNNHQVLNAKYSGFDFIEEDHINNLEQKLENIMPQRRNSRLILRYI